MSDRLAGEPPQIVRALWIVAVIFYLLNTHRTAVVVAIMKASQYGDVETEALSGTLVDVGCLGGVAILEVERRQRHGVVPSNKQDSFACRVAHDEAMINEDFSARVDSQSAWHARPSDAASSARLWFLNPSQKPIRVVSGKSYFNEEERRRDAATRSLCSGWLFSTDISSTAILITEGGYFQGRQFG